MNNFVSSQEVTPELILRTYNCDEDYRSRIDSNPDNYREIANYLGINYLDSDNMMTLINRYDSYSGINSTHDAEFLLKKASVSGNIELIEKLFPRTKVEARRMAGIVLRNAARHGHSEILLMMLNSLPKQKDYSIAYEALFEIIEYDRDDLFDLICQWIIDNMDSTRNEYHFNQALNAIASRKGYCRLRWTQFLVENQYATNCDEALIVACNNNNRSVGKYLFGKSSETIRNYALKTAKNKNHAKMVKILNE